MDYWTDAYFRLWARYHVYGLGVLFGWFISHYRTVGKEQFLGRYKGIKILIGWTLCLGCLVIPMYMMPFCFKADSSHPDFLDPELKWNAFSGCASTNLSASFWNASFRI